jgi:hypothetical protein
VMTGERFEYVSQCEHDNLLSDSITAAGRHPAAGQS